MSYIISKSSYLKGLQCSKLLYLYKHHYHFRNPVSAEQQLIFDRGHEVGSLAQKLFPGGVNVSPPNPKFYKQSLQKTKELIQKERTIVYEAAFVGLNTLIYCDILVKNTTGFKIYEVKSSLKLSKTFYQDVALQYAVLKDLGLSIEGMYLVNLNSEYRLQGHLDINSLFKITDVTDYCKENYFKVRDDLKAMIKVLQQNNIPEVDVGPHCNKPYPCDFSDYCWKNVPEDSVYRLQGVSQELLENWSKSGIHKISQIQNIETIQEPLRTSIKAKQAGRLIIDKPRIVEFISEIKFPITFFDIESIMPAIPKFEGTGPFHNLPVMFSALTVDESGSIDVNFWMHETDSDPRKSFVEQFLKTIPKIGSLVVFDKTSELNILNKLFEEFPEYLIEFNELQKRIFDLALPFTNRWCYHPEFNGGSSLKLIAHHLLKENPYAELQINSGVIAMHAYQKMLNSNDIFEQSNLKTQLKEYSLADTKALYQTYLLLKDIVLRF